VPIKVWLVVMLPPVVDEPFLREDESDAKLNADKTRTANTNIDKLDLLTKHTPKF
jgi:hypothetical protein